MWSLFQTIQDIEFTNKLIKNSNQDLIYKNLEYLNKEYPEKLEKVIINYHDNQYFWNLKEKIIKDFSEKKVFKYSNKLLENLQKELRDEFYIASYKRYIIDIFTIEASHHDEGDNYLKIVDDYAK